MFNEIEEFTQKYITNEIVVERETLRGSKFKKFKKQLGDLIHKDYPGFSYEVWGFEKKIDRYFFKFHELKEIPVNKILELVSSCLNPDFDKNVTVYIGIGNNTYDSFVSKSREENIH